MSPVVMEADFECETITGLAGDESARCGARRSTRPTLAWLEPRSSIGRPQPEVDFVGRPAVERSVRANLVVPSHEAPFSIPHSQFAIPHSPFNIRRAPGGAAFRDHPARCIAGCVRAESGPSRARTSPTRKKKDAKRTQLSAPALSRTRFSMEDRTQANPRNEEGAQAVLVQRSFRDRFKLTAGRSCPS